MKTTISINEIPKKEILSVLKQHYSIYGTKEDFAESIKELNTLVYDNKTGITMDCDGNIFAEHPPIFEDKLEKEFQDTLYWAIHFSRLVAYHTYKKNQQK